MAALGKGNPEKVVMAALVGNAAIAVSKFVAAYLSGSITMLAEGVHSVADTANQALLLLGMKLSKRKASDAYPLGREKETYFWAFMVSLVLFFLGGVYAVYEGIHKLLEGSTEPGSLWVPVVVLVLSMAFESGSFYVAVSEFNRERGGRGVWQALFEGKNPVIPLVVLEDAGALGGLVVALVAVFTSWITGSTVADGVGSIVIGVMLCAIGVMLAHDTRSLLLGESATPEMRRRALEAARGADGVEAVTEMLTLHVGPEAIMLALKVRFRAGMTVAESERVVDDLEARVRGEIPQIKRIFVEADGDYVPSAEAPTT
jgi:cation diffusion facilitator family transporter